LLKEAYRLYAREIIAGKDLIFIARAPAATFNFEQAAAEMRQLLKKGGLFAHSGKR
jgi:ribonuclease P protein component